MADDNPKKKNSPYPFPGTLELQGKKEAIEIMLLAENGLMANVLGLLFVGKHYQLTFQIPGLPNPVSTEAQVVKTTDRSIDPKTRAVIRLAEIHFINLSAQAKNSIASFLAAVGQR